jgi:hypothetical protein
MKRFLSLFLLFAVTLGTLLLQACNKNNNAGPGTQPNQGQIPGTWATRVFINSTNGHADTLLLTVRPDTLQFTSGGKLNAAYYVQTFDTTTDQVVWLRTVDSASYTFLDDSTIHVTGHTSLYMANNSGDIFKIRYLDMQQLQLYAPDQGGSGGYMYVYSRF